MDKNQLFSLIKSLTPSEKRYFKKICSNNKKDDNDYVTLFDIYNKIENYDQDQINLAVKSTSFQKSLEVKKHYLYELILSTLRLCSSNNDENQIQNIRLLISKNLHDQAIAYLNKVKLIVEKKEDFLLEIKLHQIGLELAVFSSKVDRKQIELNLLTSLKRLNNEQQYSILLNNLKEVLNRYSFVRTEEQKSEYDLVCKSRLLKSKNNALSFRAKQFYFQIQYYYHISIGLETIAVKFAHQGFKEFETSPNFKNIYPELYLSCLSNFLGSNIFTTLSLRKKGLLSIQNFISVSLDLHFKLIAKTNLYQFSLIYNNHGGTQKKAFEEALRLIGFLEENESLLTIAKLKFLYFEIGKTFFYQCDYSSAYFWFQKPRFPHLKNENADIFSFSRVYSLFCLAMNGETELMTVNLNTLKKQLKKLGILYDFEKFLLDFLAQKMSQWSLSKFSKRLNILNDLEASLEKYISQAFYINTKKYIDLEKWILSERKILGELN